MKYSCEDNQKTNGFIAIPKTLFSALEYKNLSALAKMAYGFMQDRASLSKRNGENWIDDHGNIYIFFTVKELAERLGCSEDKASKIMKELEKHKLIARTRQGQGRPWRVVVNSVIQSPAETGSRSGRKHVPDHDQNGVNNTYKLNLKNKNRRHDEDEILAIHRMVTADDYIEEFGTNNGVED